MILFLKMAYQFWQFWKNQGRFILLGAGIGLLILGFFLLLTDSFKPAADVEFFSAEENLGSNSEKSPQIIMIDIGGAVNRPGVYQFDNNDIRLTQAIEAAGGISSQAAHSWMDKNLNLARKVADGEKIYIPYQQEIDLGTNQAGPSGQIAGIEINRLVNINTAGVEELCTLSGIGPSFAQKIIDYRTQNNGFVSIEEIMAVDGIGEKTFEKIKDKISL